jgi:hypothetical protein
MFLAAESHIGMAGVLKVQIFQTVYCKKIAKKILKCLEEPGILGSWWEIVFR